MMLAEPLMTIASSFELDTNKTKVETLIPNKEDQEEEDECGDIELSTVNEKSLVPFISVLIML